MTDVDPEVERLRGVFWGAHRFAGGSEGVAAVLADLRERYVLVPIDNRPLADYPSEPKDGQGYYLTDRGPS